jgi:hypothetical protein
MPNYPRIVACLLDRQGGDKSAKIDSAFIFFLKIVVFLFDRLELLDGWVIPNPSGENAHFEKGKKVLLGILVARDCTGAH